MSWDGTDTENTRNDGNLYLRIVTDTEAAYHNKKEKTQNNKPKHYQKYFKPWSGNKGIWFPESPHYYFQLSTFQPKEYKAYQ